MNKRCQSIYTLLTCGGAMTSMMGFSPSWRETVTGFLNSTQAHTIEPATAAARTSRQQNAWRLQYAAKLDALPNRSVLLVLLLSLHSQYTPVLRTTLNCGVQGVALVW